MSLIYTSEADDAGKRHVLCQVCNRKWFTTWGVDRIHHACNGQQPQPIPLAVSEVAELFPNEDPTLLGNRIKALTTAIGIPTCGGCESRRQWINKAHLWLRSNLDPTPGSR